MQAPRAGSLPAPRNEASGVKEWDDGSCLSRAVDRLDAERREVRDLAGMRRCVTLCTGLTLTLLGALTLFALIPTVEPLMAAAMIGLFRGVIVEGIDQEIAQHRQNARLRQQEVMEQLEASDWLLQP